MTSTPATFCRRLESPALYGNQRRQQHPLCGRCHERERSVLSPVACSRHNVGRGEVCQAAPRVIQATYPGNAQDANDGVLTSVPPAFSCSARPCCFPKAKCTWPSRRTGVGLYHGWVIAFDATTMRQVGAWVSTPNGYQGGIWISGCGITADQDGNLFLSVANGPFDAFGEEPQIEFQRQYGEL